MTTKHPTRLTTVLPGAMAMSLAAVIAAAVLWIGAGRCLAQDTSGADTKPAATEPASKPATEPATEPATAPASEPATQATTEPTTMATTQPTTDPATQALTTRPAPQPYDPAAPIDMNFKEASLRTVLDYLSDAAGLIIIGDPKVEGRISIRGRNISVEEAVKLLDSALREKGYAAVHVERTLKILTIADAMKDHMRVNVSNNPKDIPLGDAMVTQVIPIRNADAVKLKGDLASLIPSSADVASNASSNTLIVRGSQTVVRQIVEIVRGIDVGGVALSQVRVYTLKNANATSTAKLITDIFKAPSQNQPQPGGGGGGRRQQFVWPGMPQQQEDDKGGKSVPVTASADDRTNTVVVSASPEVLIAINKMVDELDKKPDDPNAVFIYHLKNVQASNLEPVLNSVFGWSGSGSTAGGTSTNRNSNVSGNTGITGRSNNFGGGPGGTGSGGFGNVGGNVNRGGNTGNTNRGVTNNAGRSPGIGGGNRGQIPGDSGGTSDLLGQVSVVADNATNSLLVTTASKNFKRVKEIIEDLDRAVPQVLIKVLVCEVTHTNDIDLGVEFSGMNLRGADAVQGLGVGKQVPNTAVKEGRGQSSGTNFGVMGEMDGFTFKLDERYVQAAIHAISTVGKLDVLSRPYILTSNNQQATIFIGETMPYIATSQITSDGQVINTPQYKDIGIQLDVTPSINPQGLVTLDVVSEISSDTGRTVTLTQSLTQTTESPVFARRYAVSRVAVRNGQTIVIGGLMEDKIIKSIDKVPFLGDIPLLGLLFQHTTELKSKTELLIFLTPHVAKQADELKGMTESEKSGTKIVKDAVEPGVYPSHLKGMELGASTRPASAPADEDPAYYPGGDPATRPAANGSATTQPADKDGPTSRPAAGEPDDNKP